MKQSAPFDWQLSSSDGVRVRSRGRPGELVKQTGGGGLSGADIPEELSDSVLLWPAGASQKPEKEEEERERVQSAVTCAHGALRVQRVVLNLDHRCVLQFILLPRQYLCLGDLGVVVLLAANVAGSL